MTDHPYLCDCYTCAMVRYSKTMDEIKRRVAQENYTFLYGKPPEPNPDGSYTFKFKKKDEIIIDGEYRRFQDRAFDVTRWQYKPWPEADWKTYFTVTNEELQKRVKMFNSKVTAKDLHFKASRALAEERFYKVERIN